jgi:hypothetical protein
MKCISVESSERDVESLFSGWPDCPECSPTKIFHSYALYSLGAAICMLPVSHGLQFTEADPTSLTLIVMCRLHRRV